MSRKKSSSVSFGNKKVPQEQLWNPESVVGWEDNATHGQGASGNSSLTGSSGSCSRVDGAQEIDEERAALLRAKQSELDMIEDQHDNLVRVGVLCRATPSRYRSGDAAYVLGLTFTIVVGTRSISSGTVDDLGYI